MFRHHAVISRRVICSVVVAATVGLSACGSDDASSADTATSATEGATEDEDEATDYPIVPDAVVTAGLAGTITALTTMSAAPATATPEALDAVFTDWSSYEGTVRENDVNTYLTFEDSLGAFKKAAEAGDQAAMNAALADFTTASSTYLAAYPG